MSSPIDREEFLNDLRDEELVRVAGCQAKAGTLPYSFAAGSTRMHPILGRLAVCTDRH